MATKSKTKSTTTKKPVKKTTSKATKLNSSQFQNFTPYKPKKNEEYMSPEQLEHFKVILSNWRLELMEQVDGTVNNLQEKAGSLPDPNDRASQESEFGLELKTRDRERKLLRKIASALSRVEDGSYGFCEETGEEIGLRRLEARPIATLCFEAQERHEITEQHYSDMDD